ncbi:MAG TPA: ABC transporter permease [Chthoniobacterales bacterium]
MNLFAAFEVGLREILSHKFRSFLSMLGIVLGVSSLVATMAITAGIERGTRKVMQQIGGLERVGVTKKDISSEELDFWTFSPGRTLQDAYAIKKSAPLISHISPEISEYAGIASEAANQGRGVGGVYPDYFPINQHELAAGRFITDIDVENGNRVVVLGQLVCDKLFPGQTPWQIAGQFVYLNQIPFEVVGVLKNYQTEANRMTRPGGNRRGGWDPFRGKNETTVIPFTTLFYELKSGKFPQDTPDSVPLQNLYLRVGDLNFFQEALDQVRTALEITHRGVEDFDFETRQDFFDRIESSMRSTRISGGLIAAISLLVGGIGITNIMLASISERVREIGIRLAIGARGRDIFVQIIVESVTIAILGGLFGVVVGVGLIQLLTWLAPGDNLPVLTWMSVVLSVCFATLAGVLSGIYPAMKAAGLDPISALRYE